MRRLQFFLALLLNGALAQAADFWGDNGFKGFCDRLPALPESVMTKELGGYFPTLRAEESLTLSAIRQVDEAGMSKLLLSAARSGWGMLETFTQKELSDAHGCALWLDQATLAQINRKFNLHALWQIVARLSGNSTETISMRYMIVGQGRLIIGYPRAAEIEINDGDAISGRYNYAPYISARIEHADTSRGLFGIRTLTVAGKGFEPFIGPYGVAVTALKLEGQHILVKYTLGFEQERLTKNLPITPRDLVVSRH